MTGVIIRISSSEDYSFICLFYWFQMELVFVVFNEHLLTDQRCGKTADYEYNGQIIELCGVPIALCVQQILGCVHHHDWLNMAYNMPRLAQFSQQV